LCLGCGEVGPLHAQGHCRRCYRRTDISVACRRCGRERPAGLGWLWLCSDCHDHRSELVRAWLDRHLSRLGVRTPSWFPVLAGELAELCDPKNAISHLSRIERLLASGIDKPVAVQEALYAVPGHRATAILTTEFFGRRLPTVADDSDERVLARRQQRLSRIPERLRPGVKAFLEDLRRGQRRATLYGHRGLSDRTIDHRLAALVHLADHLYSRGIDDWASVITSDIETFLTIDVSSRLATVRAFFAFARRHKLVLVNPATGIARPQRKGYTGRLLTPTEQRSLLRRWTRSDVDPRERVVGLLCLLHAASNIELRHLTVDRVDLKAATLWLGRRQQAVPLDPLTTDALRACLELRAQTPTYNPHLLITHHTRLHDGPCSVAFPIDVLARSGVTTQILRQTRLADLAHRTDPRVVAGAIGITKEAALHYVTGTVDQEAVAFSHLQADVSER
jgi:hypothetical protein